MADSAHVQALFYCEDARFSIPDSQYSIPISVTRVELNELINQITSTQVSSATPSKHEFDFLLQDKLLRGTLGELVAQNQLPSEQVLRIQCILRNPPPTLGLELEHKDWVSAVHCCNDLILTGCYDNSVRVWTNKGDLVCVAEGHTAPVKDLRWISANDKECLFLSSSQDQYVHIWKMTMESQSDGGIPVGHVTLLHQCKGHARSVEAVDVSTDRSKFCSVSWDSYVKIWSTIPDSIPLDEVDPESDKPTKKRKTDSHSKVTTRTPLVTLQGHNNAVTTVVWAGPNEEAELGDDIITGGWDNCIKLWDVSTCVNKTTLNCPKAFHCIALSGHSNLLASGNSDRTVRLWDPRQTETCLVHSSLTSHSGWVVSVAWSPHNPHHLLSGSYDSTLRLWDTRSNKKPLFSMAAHDGKVLCADWTNPKMLASGGTDNKLRTFSL